MNLFVHPSKGFSNPSVDTELSTERITVVPTAHTLPPALLTRFTASAVSLGNDDLLGIHLMLGQVLDVDGPEITQSRHAASGRPCRRPLISSLFIRCLLKCSPAVGAATAPSFFAKIV